MKKRIGFGKRFLAYFMDWMIIIFIGPLIGIAIGFGIGMLLGGGYNMASGKEAAALSAGLGGYIGAMLGGMAGHAFSGLIIALIEGFTGSSPGKAITHIQIAHHTGKDATVDRLMTRSAIKYGNYLLLLLAVLVAFTGFHAAVYGLAIIAQLLGLVVTLGCLLVLGEQRMALHDMVATTAVFSKNDLP